MNAPKGYNFYQKIMIPDEYHKELEQPMVYTKGLSTVPCKPYVGCMYPTKNPMQFRQELTRGIISPFRPEEPKKKTCTLSWRDCPAYADCVKGNCVPKKGI